MDFTAHLHRLAAHYAELRAVPGFADYARARIVELAQDALYVDLPALATEAWHENNRTNNSGRTEPGDKATESAHQTPGGLDTQGRS